MTIERGLRGVAVLIALLAFIDPVFSASAQVRPTVVVSHASPADGDLAAQITDVLTSNFNVAPVEGPDVAAHVLAGSDLPDGWRPPPGAAVFAVTPDAARLGVRVVGLTVPSTGSIDSVVPVTVDVQVDGTGDRDVTIALLVDGVRQHEATRRLTGQETRMTVPLTVVPSRRGVARVRAEVTVPGRDITAADVAIEMTARVWRVLAFDGRPSYAATFIRRALESDPRFQVTTRIVTSRGSAVQTGAAPPSLGDARALDAFDLVVVGAADALGTADAASLERYLRERHGAVILLPEAIDDRVLSHLTGQAAWQEDRRAAPVAVTGTDTWAATEFYWPVRWPPLTAPLATFALTPPAAVTRFPVWQMPVGSGRLVVSSATDGWRSRAGAALGFSAFWRSTAAAAANATPPLVSVDLARRVWRPGQSADVNVELFSGGAPTARLRDPSGAVWPIRLWPADGTVTGARDWEGGFRTPDVPGRYRLEVATDAGATGAAELLVVGNGDAWVPPVSGDGLAAMAATAHGGAVVPAAQVATLPALMAAALAIPPSRQPWHPMRSVWWLVPLTASAAGEWWLRRRRGQR